MAATGRITVRLAVPGRTMALGAEVEERKHPAVEVPAVSIFQTSSFDSKDRFCCGQILQRKAFVVMGNCPAVLHFFLLKQRVLK